jgi:hypothetical protein
VKADTGYSGTPLARKLGYAAGSHVVVMEAPQAYREWLAPLPEGVVFERAPGPRTTLVHLFATDAGSLRLQLAELRERMAPATALWISWPKKASKLPTDLSEDVIRALALPLGLVDVKVCAVDEVWSALKLVIRKALR